ncbi:Nramp family divalent metal transporter [Mycolicibacterium goodii]|uniref:Divalent metal cation transporter n=1 Tax=Mycolicibacterium goodii TaxID=134601 RepID=A0A0K0X3Z4_MYCGD|nr:hypothetical protein AFA91_09495 [Mycolicibacterium goodii]
MVGTKEDVRRRGAGLWHTIALFGPGLALAATSVGAGDMVSTLEGAGSFGMGLVWVAVVGVLIKFVLTEASGRLQLAGPTTLLSKIGSVHIAFAWLFLIVVLVMTTLYGAALGSVAALALKMMIPALPIIPTTVAMVLVSGAIVYVGKWERFEKYMVAFAVVMFLGVIVMAVVAAGAMEDPSTIVDSLRISIPDGSMPAALAMIGGVGGSATIAIYAYWVRDKGWTTTDQLRSMRKDAALSYVAVLVFMVSMSVVGTALVFGTGMSLSGPAELEALGGPLGAAFGEVVKVGFFVTFFVVVFSSLVGGFNGFCYMLSDCIRVVRRVPDADADRYIRPQGRLFNLVLAGQVIAPLVIMFTGRPVQLVLAYAISGAFFLPVLIVAFLILLNRKSVPAQLRNRLAVNVVLGLSLLLFGWLAVTDLIGRIAG